MTYDPTYNPAACGPEQEPHTRAGIVTNQDPDDEYNHSRPYRSRAVCERETCRQIAIGWVAETGEPGRYYDDAERRAKKVDA